MPPTPSSPPRSPSSTRWPTSARRWTRTCRMWPAASAWTGASAASSCMPGPGYGGSCFPKDTLALLKTAQQMGAPTRIVEAVVAVNESARARMADKIVERTGRSCTARPSPCSGLTFKPNTDDMRDAPSLVDPAGAAGTRRDDPGLRSGRHEGSAQASRRRLPRERL